MTGASSGDAEDLLGQFLAHRAAPASARPATAAPPPPPSETPHETDELSDDERTDEEIEESVDGPVYELADAPLDFPEPEPEPEPDREPEPVADTMAHAGAVLEAFAAGTLDVTPEGTPDLTPDLTPDAALDDTVYEVTPDLEDLEVEAVTPVGDTPATAASSPANDASRAVLAAFLGTAPEEPPTGSQPPPAQPEPEPDLLAPEPEPEPEAPAAAPDEAAAFEALAVSSPLTRETSGPATHRAAVPAEVHDDRPDSTAASATVFAAFQEQLAGREAAARGPEPAPIPEPSPAPSPARTPAPSPAPVPEPSPEPIFWHGEPSVPEVERPLEAEFEAEFGAEHGAESPAETPIAPPTTRAQAPKPARHRPPKAAPRVTAPRLPPAAAPTAEPVRPAVPNEIVFKPRRMARALVALILLVFVAASAIACWWAYRDRTLVPVGIAATVLIATGIVWATRAGSTVAHLSVKGGRLEITKDGTRTVFDLTSQYTDIAVHGTPGRRNWRVMFGRRGLPPFVVDATMVSPAEFMRVLDYYRPPENRGDGR